MALLNEMVQGGVTEVRGSVFQEREQSKSAEARVPLECPRNSKETTVPVVSEGVGEKRKIRSGGR